MSLAQPETWQITKPARTSRGGIVVSQHVLASKAGAAVLEAGGNAVDAAVATAFALGVVEPWMSGIGGIGYLLYAEAKTGKVSVVDFGRKRRAAWILAGTACSTARRSGPAGSIGRRPQVTGITMAMRRP